MPPFTSEQAKEFGRRGGQARAAACDMRELGSRGGAATVERHGREHMRRIGKRGAWTTPEGTRVTPEGTRVERYGPRFLAEIGRQRRLDNPTGLELSVGVTLQELGFVEGRDYEREGYLCPDSGCHHYTGDFVFRPDKLVVYADGARWHQNSDEIGPRADQDAELDRWLHERGWTVLRLPEAVIAASDGQLKQELAGALPAPPTQGGDDHAEESAF